MNIVSSCDDNFVPCFAAMLHSASLYHPDAHYWLLAQAISDENVDKLTGFAASLGLKLTILRGFEADLAGLPVRGRFTVATYSRLLIPRLLPQTLDRALYLDADITVLGPLDDLFAVDLKGMPLAAVRDLPKAAKLDLPRLGLPPETPYVNSGVMLFDLHAWRREDLSEQVLTFVRAATEDLWLVDQSALNAVLANRVLIVPPRWNLSDFNQWEKAVPPAAVHYILHLKPWIDPRSPFRELYTLHLSKTPFPFVAPPLRLLKHVRRTIGAYLGIRSHRRYRAEILRDRRIHDAIAVPSLAEATRLIAERDGRREEPGAPQKEPAGAAS